MLSNEKTNVIVNRAQWSAPSHVKAMTTLRTGGTSKNSFDSLNLATHVGDDPIAVEKNRIRLKEQLMLPSEPIWLHQIHGRKVIRAGPSARDNTADGSYTREQGVVCAILTADCMPLFLTDRFGGVVCLLHVGWRGLLAGVIESGLVAVGSIPRELSAWIGPGIGRDAFVVGDEVRQKLIRQFSIHSQAFEKYNGKWIADLGQMVEERLQLAGVTDVQRSEICTSKNPSAFFSYRRDGLCGRMASLIWLD